MGWSAQACVTKSRCVIGVPSARYPGSMVILPLVTYFSSDDENGMPRAVSRCDSAAFSSSVDPRYALTRKAERSLSSHDVNVSDSALRQQQAGVRFQIAPVATSAF